MTIIDLFNIGAKYTYFTIRGAGSNSKWWKGEAPKTGSLKIESTQNMIC